MLKKILIGVGVWIYLYLFLAYITLEFNPIKWVDVVRFSFVAFGTLGMVVAATFYKE